MINVGNNGSLSSINGGIAVNDIAPVTIDDSADNASHNSTLTAGSLTGLSTGAINFSAGIGPITIKPGEANNDFTVQDTPSSVNLNTGNGNSTIGIQGTTGTLAINEGTGNNTVNVGSTGTLDAVKGTITLTGGAGFNTLNLIDNGAAGDNAYFFNGANPAKFSFKHNANLIPVFNLNPFGKKIFKTNDAAPNPIVNFTGMSA